MYKFVEGMSVCFLEFLCDFKYVKKRFDNIKFFYKSVFGLGGLGKK